MTLNGWMQIALYGAVVLALVRPLGGYMTRVFDGERTLLSPALAPIERGLYRVSGIDARQEQTWLGYAGAMVLFNVAGFVLLYALLRLQALLPFNPAEQAAVAPDLAFNTATSFVTNTNWQSYGGETTLSYLSQMLGLTHQNFVSAASGMAVAVALIRGFARASTKTLGSFWVDMTRATLYVLLPLCTVLALFYVSQGMPQTLSPYVEATTLEGAKQTIAVGPVASQVAIKMLGTNGGGFFNANAAHPFENPTALSNFMQMLSIFVIGAALTNVFGRMVGDERQGWAILTAMGLLFIAGVTVTYWAEANAHGVLSNFGLTGGNMEGKEVRFGIAASALFAVITTAASCGAVNAMHDSFTALGGLIPLLNMQLGEVIIGGVGAGLYGMLIFVVVAIFVAGLMVGRTPEYLGKKIEAREVKMAMLGILCLPLMMLGGAGRSRRARECRPARFLGDPLRLHLSRRQQRLGLRRADGQHAVLQHHAGHRHARRPLLREDPGSGHRRLARRQEAASGFRRHLPDPWRAVRRPPRRRGADHRRPDFLSVAGARPGGRALRRGGRPDLRDWRLRCRALSRTGACRAITRCCTRCCTTGPTAPRRGPCASRTSCWPSSLWRCSAASPSRRPSPWPPARLPPEPARSGVARRAPSPSPDTRTHVPQDLIAVQRRPGRARAPRLRQEARPPLYDPQPGHVRGRGRGSPDHRAVRP
jgi:potassium-transporting ATPase potassium-binding subunit